LAIYFFLVVRCGWTEAVLHKVEPDLQAVPLLWSTGTAIAGLPLSIFGNANLWCWIAPSYDSYRWGFFYGPLWLMILTVTMICVIILWHVYKLEQTSRKYRFSSYLTRAQNQNLGAIEESIEPISSIDERFESSAGDPGPSSSIPSNLEQPEEIYLQSQMTQPRGNGERPSTTRAPRIRRASSSQPSTRSRTKEVAIQCFLYAGAFYLNWFALTLTRLLQAINGKTYFPLLLVASIMTPIQGLPNVLVYLRQPRQQMWRSVQQSLAARSSMD
jgi:hypothetical protein